MKYGVGSSGHELHAVDASHLNAVLRNAGQLIAASRVIEVPILTIQSDLGYQRVNNYG